MLAVAPTPARGRSLTVADLVGMCGRAGRRRELQRHAEAIHRALQAEQLAAPALLADAYGASVAAIVGVLTSLSAQIDSLHATLSKQFAQHPDAEILRSLPGLGIVLGARVLGEFGDDPNRYADAKAARTTRGPPRSPGRPANAGPCWPGLCVTGRLADPLVWWAFCSLTCSPGARPCYDHHRARRPPISKPSAPGQPMGRHPPRLPAPPSLLRRTHRLARTPTTRCLTASTTVGCLAAISLAFGSLRRGATAGSHRAVSARSKGRVDASTVGAAAPCWLTPAAGRGMRHRMARRARRRSRHGR